MDRTIYNIASYTKTWIRGILLLYTSALIQILKWNYLGKVITKVNKIFMNWLVCDICWISGLSLQCSNLTQFLSHNRKWLDSQCFKKHQYNYIQNMFKHNRLLLHPKFVMAETNIGSISICYHSISSLGGTCVLIYDYRLNITALSYSTLHSHGSC